LWVMWLSNLVTTINHDQPVRRLEHSETQLTSDDTSRSSEQQREFTIGRDAGAAYVKIIWLGFLLSLAVAIHHYLSRVVLLF
jgi:hypothetical protein